MVAVMTRKPERLAYDDPCGALRLRTALQGYLWRSRSVRCDVDQIVVVNGSQQGLDICARLLLRRRRPLYHGGSRHTLVTIPVDRDGLETERLDTVKARLAYVTPSHQYPLGGVLPIGRRHQVLAWARKYDAYVIEDDYDSEYRYDTKPVPPLHALEGSDNVVYLGTVSKTLSPTLRIGYLVVPPGLRSMFGTAKQIMDRHTPLAGQGALASMLESGAYDSHVKRVRRRNVERQRALLDALRHRFADRIRIDGADAGLHVVVWFNDLPQEAEEALIRSARSKGWTSIPFLSFTIAAEQAADRGRKPLV